MLVNVVFQGQIGGTITRHRAHAHHGRLSGEVGRARVGDQDAGEGIGILEDGRVAEIDNFLDLGPFAEKAPQWFSVAGPEPLVGDDVTELAVRGEQFQTALVKVDVQVGQTMPGDIPPGQPGFVGSEQFLPHIGRVADHDIEAATGEDLRKAVAPVEGAGVWRQLGERLDQGGWSIGGRRLDQGIAAANGLVEVVQRLVAAGGLEPETELGDFDRFVVQIHAVQVVLQNLAVEVIQADLLGRTGQLGDEPVHPLVFLAEKIERGHQEGPGPTGRVQNLDAAQYFHAVVGDLEPGLFGE